MAQSVVQTLSKVQDANAGSSSTSSAFGSNTTTGNTILVTISTWNDAQANIVSSVTDSKGNTYTQDQASVKQTGTHTREYLYRSSNITGGASHTITVNYTGASNNYAAWAAIEVSGQTNSTPLDQATNTSSNSAVTDAAIGPTGTTTQNDEIVVAGCGVDAPNSNIAIGTATTGYTAILTEQDALSYIGAQWAYKIISTTGTQSATWSHSNTSQAGWGAVIGTYKAEVSAVVTRLLLQLGVGR